MVAATLLSLRIPDFDAAIRTAVEPRLAGRPVVVTTSFKPLGRVLAASPAARAAGVETEMPCPVARARCSDAVFFTPDKELARRAMRALLEKASEYTPLAEATGDGRVLLDTRGTEALWGAGLDVAGRVRRDVRESLRLPVAAGLATRRPWSFLASRAAGDDGMWWVAPGREQHFLDLMPTAWIDGASPRTREKLAELNIRRVGQLRQFSRAEITRQFGNRRGAVLWAVVSPEPWDAVAPAVDRRAADLSNDVIRVEAVLAEASVAEERLRVVARSLAAQAAENLRANHCGAARLRLTLLYADGTTDTATCRNGGFVQNETILIDHVLHLFAKVFKRRVKATRLWLTAEKLGEPMRQGALFPEAAGQDSPQANPAPSPRLLSVVDRIRQRHGQTAISAGVMLDHSYPRAKPRRHKRSAS